jgi:arylsulfatase A-like enzyme
MNAPLPNILVLVADCARSDKWLGRDRASRTPNLDRLTASGVALPNTIVETPCTTPSFSTLLTGLYSPRHGVHLVWGQRLGRQIPMLTHELARAGYHTYAELTGPLLAETGLDRGFEHFEYRAPCDYLHTAWGQRFVQRLRSGHYRRPWFILLHLWELHEPRCVRPPFADARFGRDAYEQAVSSLDDALTPVFDAAGDDAVIVFTGDHGEKTVREEYREGTAVSYARNLLGLDGSGGLEPYHLAQWAGPSVLHQFYGQCAPLMQNLRLRGGGPPVLRSRWERLADRLRLLWLTPWVYLHDLLTRMLERRRLLDPELSRRRVERFRRLVGADRMLDLHVRMWINSYTAHLCEGHMLHVYDFLVRVPLVIRGPGRLPAGVVVDRMVRQPDILPTLLDLLGIRTWRDLGVDGRSLRPLLDGQPWESAPALLSISGLPQDLELRGVRTERYKYTFGPHNEELPEELYDLDQDPRESVNVAHEEPQRCRGLRALADGLAEDRRAAAVEPVPISPLEQTRIEAHLRELGYIE